MTLNENLSHPVGIDLGTTYSAMAFLDNQGRPNTIHNSEGELTTPSVVYFDDGDFIVGSEAIFAGESDSTRLARAAKRDMGSTNYRTPIRNRQLPPEVIQSLILSRLKHDAELKLGKIDKVVITVPAYFNEPRRKATQDAGELAGLEVIDIINEPTAAALAYGIQRGFLNQQGMALADELVLVYDLGGGTFDVTLMEIKGSEFNTIATAGDVYLGGMDWDQRLFEYASQQIANQASAACLNDDLFRERLLNQCIRAKKTLSAKTETVIRIDFEGQRIGLQIDRNKFEDLTADLLERTRLTTSHLLQEAGKNWRDLSKLILVGGSTRMPMVANMLERLSGVTVDRSLSPDEAVAHGAAIYAGILSQQNINSIAGMSVSNVNSHDLGVLGIDPLTRKPRQKVLIARNQRLPIQAAKRFQTSKDNQQKIVVQIIEGGTEQGKGATTIGKCVVSDLPSGIKKGEEVVVSFSYLNSGRLEVTAEVPAHQRSAQSTIDRAAGMTPQQLEAWKQKLQSGADFLRTEPTINPMTSQPSLASPTMAPAQPNQLQAQSVPQPSIPTPAEVNHPKTNLLQSPAIETVKPTAGVSAISDAVIDESNQSFDMNENSGIFVFGDDPPRPDVGKSFLAAIGGGAESNIASTSLGASALDFLHDTDAKEKSAAGDSVLDFLKEVNDSPQAADNDNDDALRDFLKENQ